MAGQKPVNKKHRIGDRSLGIKGDVWDRAKALADKIAQDLDLPIRPTDIIRKACQIGLKHMEEKNS